MSEKGKENGEKNVSEKGKENGEKDVSEKGKENGHPWSDLNHP